MRVLLVDDHKLFLEGLYNLLIVHGVDVVGTANDGLEAVQKTRELQPDVVVMDIQMPRCDGISATRTIKDENPAVKVVMLTMSDADDSLFEAIRSGASGYLLKNLDGDEFCQMLAGVVQGGAPLSPAMTTKLLDEFARQPPEEAPTGAGNGDVDGLTDRQLEVLSLVSQGLTYKEVSRRLHLSERTIKYHVAEIEKRLSLKNRSQVIAYAVRNGIA
jgi:DNA-binding NarL/FixJ family response regulator